MNFQNHEHCKFQGVDFFDLGNWTVQYWTNSENSSLFLNSINQVLNHQGEQKDHIIVLLDACCEKYDHENHGHFPEFNAYAELLDWIESKSGKPLSNHSVLLFHNPGEALISSGEYYLCKLLLERYPDLTLILSSGSAHGTVTSRSFKKLFGEYKNCYHVCINDWYPDPKGKYNEFITPDYLKNYPKEKTFVYIGGGLRWHRRLLLYNLYHNNLLDNGFVTYNLQPAYHGVSVRPCKQIHTYDKNIHNMWIERDVHNILPNSMTLYDEKDLKSGTIPVLSHDNHVHAWLNIPDLDIPFYENSYVTLLPETTWWSSNDEYFRKCFVDFEFNDYSPPSNFFSEKTYRAILNGMPFVTFSNPHSLDALRRMGLKTYHPYIDETYDTIEDDQDRMASLIQTLTKLRDNPPDRSTMEKMKEIADYNRDILIRMPYHVVITDNQGMKI